MSCDLEAVFIKGNRWLRFWGANVWFEDAEKVDLITVGKWVPYAIKGGVMELITLRTVLA